MDGRFLNWTGQQDFGVWSLWGLFTLYSIICGSAARRFIIMSTPKPTMYRHSSAESTSPFSRKHVTLKLMKLVPPKRRNLHSILSMQPYEIEDQRWCKRADERVQLQDVSEEAKLQEECLWGPKIKLMRWFMILFELRIDNDHLMD